VENQQWLALAHHGVFHRAERRLNRLAAANEAFARGCQVAREDCI
jgi:hypothetical protein